MSALTMAVAIDDPEWLTSMETVLEALNEGVLITDERHRILFANSRFVEMTGFTDQDLIGFPTSHFYSSAEWKFVGPQADAKFRDGHNRYAFVLPQRDGGRLPVIISAKTIQNSGGRFGIITCTDISDQVRATEELRSANVKLQQRQIEIEEDLRLAAQVQKTLVPKSLVRDNLSVDSFFHPVHSVGGDFALVNSQESDHIGLLMGDVSGHGIGSALVANRIYSETAGHLRSGMPFMDMFAELNRFLIEEIAAGMFITVAAARIDTHLRRMIFAGAGHPPAMLVRSGQTPLLLESRNTILGVLPEAVDAVPSLELQLEPDDRIIFYTDGLTETFNSGGEMLGIEGLREIVGQTATLPAEEMKQRIVDGVADWRNGPPTDDVSLVLVHIR